MIISSFNVNSIKARLPRILEWFDDRQPDVTVLQEIKCVTDAFPAAPFEDRGYHVEVFGQKTYNGVALLSKTPPEDVLRGVPGFDDDNARYIEALIPHDQGAPVRVGGLYLPNGNPAPGPKYDYKLAWMAAFEDHARDLLAQEEAVCLLGDYNVIPDPSGVYAPDRWTEDALFRLETRKAFRRLLNLGYVDALAQVKDAPFYTFWDYQRGAWDKDHGLRIDHCLLSPQAADRLTGGDVDRQVRDPALGNQDAKPSDHVPVWISIGPKETEGGET
ncbi:Exodeoxyribonuclease III [Parvularcula bermudensis HTCC2503]|uniref:Exodeoxyribonuclease III n=1 Tax=Parvularcula bermudensis (strain ATCC BAA-594 / HTCC2503 / KCTC 12087) TaxID=314260 RepID=E0TEB0_PARBH|nr:exodeoxyribonuclease III [Parvularcula bermudensis]ADM09485.1 Exodeoxyribonuclease III [Parvularcula bermudensis HTCC2503]